MPQAHITTIQPYPSWPNSGINFSSYVTLWIISHYEQFEEDFESTDFCRLTADTFHLGHMMPAFATAVAHAGPFLCPMCQRFLLGLRQDLTGVLTITTV